MTSNFGSGSSFLLPFAARTRHFFSRPHQALSTRHQAPNPVGYQKIRIPQGYSIFTPTFKNVDPSKTNTLADITVLNANQEEFDGDWTPMSGEPMELHMSVGLIQLRKVYNAKTGGNRAGDVMGSMSYTTAKYNSGDLKGQTKKWDANSTVPLVNGEGVIVHNNQKTDVYFQISGEVEVSPLIRVPEGYSIFGNYTPNDIKLKDITVLNKNGVEFDGDWTPMSGEPMELHMSVGLIQLRKVYNAKTGGNRAGDVMGSMSYTTAKYNSGDLKGQTKKWDANSDVDLTAGEAVIVYNNQKTEVFFQLKSPVVTTPAE